MENIIFFFSGTGNSLAAAHRIKTLLPNTELVSITDAVKDDHIDLFPYIRIGIVCPAYFSSLPPIVGRFISKLQFVKGQYIFAAVTAGAVFGSSFSTIDSLVTKGGGRLSAAYFIQMPGNYIALYGAWPALYQRFLIGRAEKKITKISEDIKTLHINRSLKKAGENPKTLSEKIRNFEKFAQYYHVNEKCIGCETCIRICPVQNIKKIDNRIQFGMHCERCMACIQWCPAEAIEYKNVTSKRTRYKHPDIKAADLYPKGASTHSEGRK